MNVPGNRTGKLLDRLGSAANLRAGEAPLVLLMLAHSFLNGIPKTLTNSAASAIFLEQHGAKYLPYAYMASAVIVTLIGLGFLKLGKLLSFPKRLQAVLVLVIAGELALRASISVFGVNTASIVFPVWTEIEWSIFPLAYWSLAGQLFNVQQGKRIFTLLGLGELVSSTLLGFLMPAIVSAIGAYNVMLLSALGAAASLFVLRKVLALAAGRLDAASEEEGHGQQGSGDPGEGPVRHRRYSFLLFALVAFSFLSAYFMDNVFSSRAEARYLDANQLAGFLGVFWGTCNLAALVFKTGFAGRLLSRYGLTLGILALPTLLLLGQGSAALTGMLSGRGAAMFWIVVVTRGFDYVTRDALDGPSNMILFQPLPPNARAATQARADGIIGPIAGGLSGLVLALLTHVLDFNSAQLAAVAALCACGWWAVAWRLRTDYKSMLEEALAGRRLRGLTISLDDPATRAVLERGIGSPLPGEALYALQVIEELDSRALQPTLVRLLSHPDSHVRVAALLRIERHGFDAELPEVIKLLEQEPVAEVRGAAVRVLASLGSEDAVDRAVGWLDNPEREIRDGAVVGLLRSGDVDGIVAGGQRLTELVRSPEPEQRQQAAALLLALEMDSFYRPLGVLLRDPDLRVRRKALEAAERHGNPRLWPLLCDNLAVPAVRAPAARALAVAGEPVLPHLEQALASPSTPELRARIAAVLGRIRGKRAVRVLLKMMATSARGERLAALTALSACDWQPATEEEIALARGWLDEELQSLRGALAARIDLGGGCSPLLSRALVTECESARDRVLLELSLLFETRPMQRARAAFQNPSPDERALASELVHGLLPQDLKGTIAPLLEELSPEELLPKLAPRSSPKSFPNVSKDAPTAKLAPGARLALLLGPGDRVRSEWLTVCALHELGLRGERGAAASVASLTGSPDPLVRETAARVQLLLERPEAAKAVAEGKDGPVLLTIEKVMILRSVQIFAETPDSVLAEIAAILKEVDLPAGGAIFAKGDTGDCLYVIGHGKVRIHDGDLTLTTLGERDIFGELALLDAEPRSASATAEGPTRLFRVDQEAFYDLMADRIEVVRGILRVLCRRVRAKNTERVVAAAAHVPPPAPRPGAE